MRSLRGCRHRRHTDRHADRHAPSPTPRPRAQAAWRAACVAYREKRRAGAFDHEAHCAAVAALQAVWPLPWKEASAEVGNAVHFASVYHKEWLWDGVGVRIIESRSP